VISGHELKSMTLSGILEPLRNNSVCHKWPQAGSGPTNRNRFILNFNC
jgi:hypothetical protein